MNRFASSSLKDSLGSRRGLGLLIVIATLVVAGVALANLATAAAKQARIAAIAIDGLQQREGERSVREAMFKLGPALLNQLDAARKAGVETPSTHSVAASVVLDSQRFDAIVSDESAKVSLDAIYHAGELPAVERTLRDVLPFQTRPLVAVQPQVQPVREALTTLLTQAADENEEAEPPPLPPAFTSWADIVDVARLRSTFGDARQLATITQDITIFSLGQLNVRRATDDAVLAVAESIVPAGTAQTLLKRLRENPTSDIAVIILNSVSDNGQQTALGRLLGTTSTSISVWVESTSSRSRTQSFRVRTTDASGVARTEGFRL